MKINIETITEEGIGTRGKHIEPEVTIADALIDPLFTMAITYLGTGVMQPYVSDIPINNNFMIHLRGFLSLLGALNTYTFGDYHKNLKKKINSRIQSE